MIVRIRYSDEYREFVVIFLVTTNISGFHRVEARETKENKSPI